jgi:uncharacterized protein HemY
MAEPGRMLIVLGAVLIAAGVLLIGMQKLPFLGRLPGDILIKRQNFTFYAPLTAGIILSILLSLALYLINKFK